MMGDSTTSVRRVTTVPAPRHRRRRRSFRANRPEKSEAQARSGQGLRMVYHQLEFGHLFDRVTGPLFAHAAFLEAAVRHEVGAELRAGIDV